MDKAALARGCSAGTGPYWCSDEDHVCWLAPLPEPTAAAGLGLLSSVRLAGKEWPYLFLEQDLWRRDLK